MCQCTVRSAHPVSVLEGPDEQVYEPGDGSVLPERSMIRGTQRQVPDQTDHRLKYINKKNKCIYCPVAVLR
jgi:hypothetical protein